MLNWLCYLRVITFLRYIILVCQRGSCHPTTMAGRWRWIDGGAICAETGSHCLCYCGARGVELLRSGHQMVAFWPSWQNMWYLFIIIWTALLRRLAGKVTAWCCHWLDWTVPAASWGPRIPDPFTHFLSDILDWDVFFFFDYGLPVCWNQI